jgi:uncharacterized damage-inducible protein DinB
MSRGESISAAHLFPPRLRVKSSFYRSRRRTCDTQTERFQAGLAMLTPEALERPMPGPDSGGELTETLRSLLATILFHQGYHAGQTGVLRRIAGKPGAIP